MSKRIFTLEINCGADWPALERQRLIGILTEAAIECLSISPGTPFALMDALLCRIWYLNRSSADSLEANRDAIANGELPDTLVPYEGMTDHLKFWGEEESTEAAMLAEHETLGADRATNQKENG